MKWTAENRVKAGVTGGIEAVVKAISTHIDSANVCFAGCGALNNMSFNNGKNTDKTKIIDNKMKWTVENQEKAATVGRIETVVKAVNTHIDNAGVCEQGCGALRNMTKDNSKNTKTQNIMK